MKAAICFSGHIRRYDLFTKCIDSINAHIVNQNTFCEFDFFMHTWKNLNWKHDTSILDTKIVKEKCEFKAFEQSDQLSMDHLDLSQYVKKYHLHEGSKGETVYNMYCSIYKSNELKYIYEIQNNFKYDCVIRIRPDLRISSKLFLNTLDLEKFNLINSGIVWDKSGNDYSTFTDFFCTSNSNNMNIYSSVFNNFPKLVQDTKTFRPEGLLYRQLRDSGIGYDFIDLDYQILRTNGAHTTFWKGSIEEVFNW